MTIEQGGNWQSSQVWAARRNMNLPPRITQVGAQGIQGSTAKVSIQCQQGNPCAIPISVTD